MSLHTTIHRRVRGLRKLLQLESGECTRCSSDAERERIKQQTYHNVPVVQSARDEARATLIANAQAARRTLPQRRGINRASYSYNELVGLAPSNSIPKRSNFPLAEGTKYDLPDAS